MIRKRTSFRLLALMMTIGVAALPAPVFASGFQLVEQNASGLGNAFAGQAAGVKNASAIYFNPAALTRVKGWNLVASVEPIGVGAAFTNVASTVPSAGVEVLSSFGMSRRSLTLVTVFVPPRVTT